MSAAPSMVRVFAGPVAWAVHFIAIYGVTAIACERAPASAPGFVPLAIGLLTLVAAGVAIAAMRLAPQRSLVAWVGTASAALALAAILAQAAPALLVPACR